MKKLLLILLLLLAIIYSSFAQSKGYKNPAANYAAFLGYDYKIETDANGGQRGIVIFPDGSKADEWDFYKGKAGQDFSYPVINGYDIETVVEKIGSYTKEYAVCVIRDDKGEETKIPLLEFMEQNGDKLINEVERGERDFIENLKTNPNLKDTKELPYAFDWRDKDGHSYIHGVQNQGACGSCYTFGACATAEGVYNNAMGLYDANCADFSEAYIAWCLGEVYSGFYGCDGANYDYDELQAFVDTGAVDESYFPYSDTPDPQDCPVESGTWPKIQFANWYRAACLDSTAIKNAIYNYGVVDAAVDVTTDFQNYSDGIFSDASTTCPDDEYTTTNHAISLVGWGHDPTEGLYWILRNSYGSTWGESGYMRIQWESARVACAVSYMEYTSPSVITHAATNITKDAARLNGSVNPEGVATNYYFEYGLTDSYGTSTTPVSAGSGTDPVSVYEDITGLGANTLYHYRVVATNSAKEIIYGNDKTFTTLCNDITTFPYFVGFEEATGNDFTNCWETKSNNTLNGSGLTSTSSAGGDNTWFNNIPSSFGGSGATYIHTGGGSAAIGYSAGQTGDSHNWLISPDISLISSSELTFWVWYKNNDSEGWYTNFYVQIYTVSNGWENLLLWEGSSESQNNEFVSEVVIDISAYDEQTVKIAFVFKFNNGYQMAIDDFEITGSVTSPPVTDFSGTPLTIPAGSTVDFTDLSTNIPTSWSWTFAGGTPGTSSVKNPTGIAYNLPGTYNVSLEATNGIGNDTETKTNYITATNPVIGFMAATTNTTESTSAGSGCREYTDITVTVKVTGKPDVDETVTVSVSSSTAKDPADYEITTSMPITCSAGSDANKTVTFRIYDDAAIENAETIDLSMTLGGASNAVLGTQTTHTITINDDDVAPTTGSFVTVWTENWESASAGDFSAANWSTDQKANGARNNWYLSSSSCASGLLSGMTAFIVYYNPVACGYTNEGTPAIIYRQVDASSYSDLRVSFDWLCNGNPGIDYGDLVYSTDGGSTWNDVDVATEYSGQSSSQSTTVSLTSLAGTVFDLGWAFYDDGAGTVNNPPFSVDNINVEGLVSTPIATTLSSTSSEYLGPNSTVCYYNASNDLMAKIENASDHDYGCTTVSIDRAGTGAVELFYDGTTYPDSMIIEKCFLVAPTTNNTSGIYTITFYYSSDEINGWISATSNILDDLTLTKTGGSISNITPDTQDGNGNTNYLATSVQRGTFGSSYYVQGTFGSGFSGFGSGKIEFIPKGAGPLPVELISFSCKYHNYNVILKWTTASEFNNDYFTIERSKDAIEFEIIEIIKGAGNSNNILNYETSDINPFFGTSYYRLKQTDYNGKYSISNIVSINTDINKFTDKSYNYFVNNQFLIINLNDNYYNMILEITDITGRRISSKNIQQVINSKNLKLDISNFKPGFYNFILFNNTKKISGKFIVR
ncbi:MAG: choice-of-anchor J domain-containing protein [Bacteroidales bacterium]|nr:choice-of-anchor J domain-containing protein [Bacteroidales bacterium]